MKRYSLYVPPCSFAPHSHSRMIPTRALLVSAICTAWSIQGYDARCAAQETVRFNTEVMAVLSRAGCNAGACHGNLNGKNGFKLSLRGQDPAADYLSLSRDMLGRRIDPQKPSESLILLKATSSV